MDSASTTTSDILTDPDIWAAMQVTAHFVFWTIVLETLLGFALAYLIDRKFRGHGFWTTVILIPMMLSPAVVGNFWTFLYQPQIGLFNYVVAFFTGIAAVLLPDDRRRQRWRPGRSSSSTPGCGRPT